MRGSKLALIKEVHTPYRVTFPGLGAPPMIPDGHNGLDGKSEAYCVHTVHKAMRKLSIVSIVSTGIAHELHTKRGKATLNQMVFCPRFNRRKIQEC